MKFKKTVIFLVILLTGIFIISRVNSLLANYNIVEDIRITASKTSLSEGEMVVISVLDQNVKDTKLVIPVDKNIEYSKSNYQDASVVFDSINHQIVIDWIDPSNEKKEVSISLKLNKEGIYPIKALTVRENQEVSTEEERIEILTKEKVGSKEGTVDQSVVDKESESSMNTEQLTVDEEAKSDMSTAQSIAEEETNSKFYKNSGAIQTGTWGTSAWIFDEESGVFTLEPGELGEYNTSPFDGLGREAIKKIIFIGETKAPKNSDALLYSMENLTQIEGLKNLDTSQVTSMQDMFSKLTNVQTLDVSGFDTSNVTNMSYMFAGVKSLQTLDVSGFDTSNVTLMHWMFNQVKNVQTLDVSGFDTSKVTNMYAMFTLVNSVQTLDVSHFNTSKVTNMGSMFSRTSISELDLSSFDTSKVTNMNGMLEGVGLSKMKLGDKFHFTLDAGLESPEALNADAELTGNWIRENRSSNSYSPEEFMRNYGKGELYPGIYVAETVLPGKITAEANISNQTHSDGLFYVNDEVKIENTIHHTGNVYNFLYKTTIPEELTISDETFKGYLIAENGDKIDFPVEVFKFDESRRTLEVNLKSIVEPDNKGNYYTAVDADFYYEIGGKVNKDAIGNNLEIKTTINYFNNILKPKPNVNISTENKTVHGLEVQWQLMQYIKNVSRSDGVTAVGDELEFTITATNSIDLGAMKSFDLAENNFPNELDFVSGSAELIFPDGKIKKLTDSVYQPDKQIISANVYSENGYVGIEPYQLRYKAKIKDTAYEKTLETKALLNGITHTGKALSLEGDSVKLNVDYSGKLGFKETPRTLSFKDSFISTFTSMIERKELDWGIFIEDTRIQKQPWKLSVKQVNPFESSEGDRLTQVMIFRKNGIEDQGIDVDNELDVYSESNPDPNAYFISWGKNEGFFLKVPPGTAKAKQYQTTLQWNLKDTPV